jgi:hypothetical protein
VIRLHRPPCPNPGALASGNYKHPENKEALRISTHGKCMYCESVIGHIEFARVEHIKPKAADKFPQLEFDWDNLGYVCERCNNEKGAKWFNATPFVDPYSETPADHLYAFGAFLGHRNGSERGESTIREIGLNRPDLVERRQQRVEAIKKALTACYRTTSVPLREAALRELTVEGTANSEYSLFVQALIAAHEGMSATDQKINGSF